MKLKKVTVTLITIVLVTLFAACPTVDPLFQKTQIVAILEVTSLNRERSLSVENSKCTGAFTHVIRYKSSPYWLKNTETANQCAR